MLDTIRKTAISTLAISVLGATAYADGPTDPAYLTEIDSCVAEFKAQIDTTDVHRVRHVVTESKRSRLGYALKIDTSVFTPTRESKYTVYCVAKGARPPVKFRWKEVGA